MSEKGILAKRLRIALDKREMRASELSRLSGVSKDMISRYLGGECEPKNVPLGKMSTALHVSPLWLLGMSENMDTVSEKREEVKATIDRLSDEDFEKVVKFLDIIK